MKANARRGIARGGYHFVECDTFDPKIHNEHNMETAGWYRSWRFYSRRATDEEVQAELDEFITTLREYLHGQKETRSAQ